MTVDYTAWPEDLARSYREKGYWQDLPLQSILQAQAQRQPEKTALIDGEHSFTYADIDRMSSTLAHQLAARGIRWGDTALVQLPNSAEFYVVFWALLKLGAVAVNALFSHNRLELHAYMEQIEPSLMIISEKHPLFRDLDASPFQKQHPSIRALLFQQDILKGIAGQGPVEAEAVPNLPPINASDVAFFQLSGGSTGIPKLIPRTHNDYLYSVVCSAEVCGLDESAVYLCALPAPHNFPLSSPGALGIWHSGGTVVVASDPSPQRCFPLIAKHRVTLSSLVPSLAELWLSSAASSAEDLESLKLLQVGGAKLSEGLAKRMEDQLGICLQQVFGMAEGLVNYTRPGDDLWHRQQTQGKPMSAADEIKILGADGKAVADGEVGALLTRGPYTFRGYFKAPEYNSSIFDDEGFYRTGDLVQRTADGYLIVMGREKDQINRGGEKIAAAELEALLLTHPDISQAAVVAMRDALLGEKTCAFLICPERSPKAPSLRKFLREKGLADYKLPDRIEVLPQFPLTAVGKPDKTRLRQHIDSLLDQKESV
jgi:2,3-dihydroxybenzoate-AMP ligase